MRTIATTLPVYDKLAKQTYQRAKAITDTGHGIIPIISARHRLPSFQWVDGSDGAASVTKIETVDTSGTAVDITAKFTLPSMIPLEIDYFTYKGTTLLSLLTDGIYYLRFTMNNAKVYYSEWFLVTCVFGDDTGRPPTATYSTKYLILAFSNTCDLGDLYYHNAFAQVLYLESETLEPTYPLEEEGQKNGEGRFVRTWGRQVKKYTARLGATPDYMVDVLHRLRLHNTITLIDLVGDSHTLYNLEVEHEWLYDDKYYARVDLTFDYNEAVMVSGCCTNLT